jgi:hypothetical protein
VAAEVISRLSISEAALLPECSKEEKVIVAGHKCSLTVFSQKISGDSVLVVILLARNKVWGMVNYHTERGLVFSPDGVVREATSKELTDSGG